MHLIPQRKPPFLRHPKFYKFICTSYLQLKWFLWAGDTLMPLFTAVITVVISIVACQNIPMAIVATGCVYACLFSVLGLLDLVIRWMQHTGTSDKFIFPGTHLVRKTNGEPCEVKMDNVRAENFELSTEKTAQVTAELNKKAFNDTVWADSIDEKYARNLSHIKKNRRSVLLIKDNAGNYIGFTHVLAVSEEVWKKYLDGKIKDCKFSDKLIVPTTPRLKKEKPFGLILFSVAIAERNKDFTNPATYSEDLGDLLERAMVFHFQSYLDVYFKNDSKVPILLQNMSRHFWTFFKDCHSGTKMISGDGVRIICFEVEVPSTKK